MTLVRMRSTDLETSGMKPPESVVEIGWTDLVFNTETLECEIGRPNSMLFRPKEPLTPENMAIHHLTNTYLATFPVCEDHDLRALANDDFPQFLIAHNSAFEKQWITDEFMGPAKWICTMKAALHLWPNDGHSNQAIRYRLGLELDNDLALPAHRAAPDSYVTAHIAAEMLKTNRVAQLVAWEMSPKPVLLCPLGKHRGQQWADVPADFVRWMLGLDDLDPDTRYAAEQEMSRRRAGAPQ